MSKIICNICGMQLQYYIVNFFHEIVLSIKQHSIKHYGDDVKEDMTGRESAHKGQMRNACEILFDNPERNRPPERVMCRQRG
jgi:hypothetical protein